MRDSLGTYVGDENEKPFFVGSEMRDLMDAKHLLYSSTASFPNEKKNTKRKVDATGSHQST